MSNTGKKGEMNGMTDTRNNRTKPRCVGYVRKMERLDDSGRLPTISVSKQEQGIRQMAVENGLELAGIYHDTGDDEAFLQMKQDAVYREFDTLILYSLPCFGLNIYSAVDFIRDVLIPGGFEVCVTADGFCTDGKTRDTAVAFFEEKRYAYRQVHSLIIRDQQMTQRLQRGEPANREPQKTPPEKLVPPALEAIMGKWKITRVGRHMPTRTELFRREDIREQLKEQIITEARRAEYAKGKIPTLERKRDKILAQYGIRQEQIFQEMLMVNDKIVGLAKGEAAGEGSEEALAVWMGQMEKLETEMRQCRKNIQDIKVLFSEDNPWIKLFTGPKLERHLRGELTEGVCRQWVQSWYVAQVDEIRKQERQWRGRKQNLAAEWGDFTVVVYAFSYDIWRAALGLDFSEVEGTTTETDGQEISREG